MGTCWVNALRCPKAVLTQSAHDGTAGISIPRRLNRCRMQNSLFDLENRYASLSKTGDPLERLNAIIDWELFRPILERMDAKVRKSNAGRKPTCRILMFKMLVLQRLNGLSDERLQYQVTDHLSFMRFLGVALAGNVPDARTVWAFREALREHELTEAMIISFCGETYGSGLRRPGRGLFKKPQTENRLVQRSGKLQKGWCTNEPLLNANQLIAVRLIFSFQSCINNGRFLRYRNITKEQ